jgi:hypothetical protein
MQIPGKDAYEAIRVEADKAIAEAEADTSQKFGAVNWGDIGVTEVLYCLDEDGRAIWRVVIEEASPGCGLASYVYQRLVAAIPGTTQFDVSTEW